MKIRNITAAIALFYMLAIQTFVGAQTPFKAIVLINGDAYLVELLNNGSITNRYQEVPNYFSIAATDQAIIEDLSKKGLIAAEGIDIYDSSSDEVPTAGELSIERDRHYIEFSLEQAVLNREAVDQIRIISNAYIAGTIKKVVISAYHNDTLKTRILAENRSKAIADLLNTFGVSLSGLEIKLPYAKVGANLNLVDLSFTH